MYKNVERCKFNLLSLAIYRQTQRRQKPNKNLTVTVHQRAYAALVCGTCKFRIAVKCEEQRGYPDLARSGCIIRIDAESFADFYSFACYKCSNHNQIFSILS